MSRESRAAHTVIDRFHDESVRFTDFHVAPMCTPTRGELLTGRDALYNLPLAQITRIQFACTVVIGLGFMRTTKRTSAGVSWIVVHGMWRWHGTVYTISRCGGGPRNRG